MNVRGKKRKWRHNRPQREHSAERFPNENVHKFHGPLHFSRPNFDRGDKRDRYREYKRPRRNVYNGLNFEKLEFKREGCPEIWQNEGGHFKHDKFDIDPQAEWLQLEMRNEPGQQDFNNSWSEWKDYTRGGNYKEIPFKKFHNGWQNHESDSNQVHNFTEDSYELNFQDDFQRQYHTPFPKKFNGPRTANPRDDFGFRDRFKTRKFPNDPIKKKSIKERVSDEALKGTTIKSQITVIIEDKKSKSKEKVQKYKSKECKKKNNPGGLVTKDKTKKKAIPSESVSTDIKPKERFRLYDEASDYDDLILLDEYVLEETVSINESIEPNKSIEKATISKDNIESSTELESANIISGRTLPIMVDINKSNTTSREAVLKTKSILNEPIKKTHIESTFTDLIDVGDIDKLTSELTLPKSLETKIVEEPIIVDNLTKTNTADGHMVEKVSASPEKSSKIIKSKKRTEVTTKKIRKPDVKDEEKINVKQVKENKTENIQTQQKNDKSVLLTFFSKLMSTDDIKQQKNALLSILSSFSSSFSSKQMKELREVIKVDKEDWDNQESNKNEKNVETHKSTCVITEDGTFGNDKHKMDRVLRKPDTRTKTVLYSSPDMPRKRPKSPLAVEPKSEKIQQVKEGIEVKSEGSPPKIKEIIKKNEPKATSKSTIKEKEKITTTSKETTKKDFCKHCGFSGRFLANHYKIFHPNEEVDSSKFTQSQSQEAIEDARLNMKLYEKQENLKLNGDAQLSYQCRFCPQNMKNSTHFYDHITVHTGEFRRGCSGCHFKCTHSSTLAHHMKNVHPNYEKILEPHTLKGPILYGYICGSCNYVQIHEENLRTHIKKHPGNIKPIVHKINLSSFLLEVKPEWLEVKRVKKRIVNIVQEKSNDANT